MGDQMGERRVGKRRVEYMKLAEIARAPRNPKTHDAEVIGASITRFGLADLPVLDDRTGRLVSGHGRLDDLEARHAAGESPPDGIIIESGTWLVPVIRGWASRSDPDAEAYVVAANKSTISGGWDDTALADVLSHLAATDDELLRVTGFTDDELTQLIHATSAGLNSGDGGGDGPPADFPEYDEKTISTEHQCPSCGYRWSGGKVTVETSAGGAEE